MIFLEYIEQLMAEVSLQSCTYVHLLKALATLDSLNYGSYTEYYIFLSYMP